MSLTGTAPSRGVKVGVPIADVSAGLFGVIGVLGALAGVSVDHGVVRPAGWPA
jgi:crotonobetainyl-CoA:carnitine CoA-transferase CaiB-like acyl-CoA transferase